MYIFLLFREQTTKYEFPIVNFRLKSIAFSRFGTINRCECVKIAFCVDFIIFIVIPIAILSIARELNDSIKSYSINIYNTHTRNTKQLPLKCFFL